MPQATPVKRSTVLVNVVLCQATWFACVLSAAAGHPAWGIGVATGAVLWHLHVAPAPRAELLLVGIAMGVGALFESLMVASGSVRMAPATLLGGYVPLWMVWLWACFATTLNVSLRKLRPHLLACSVLGAVGAPLSYAAGARLGALQWPRDGHGLLLVGVGWALLLPLLAFAARRHDGFATP